MATKVITGVNTRWSYANVWEPKAMEGGKPKFSVSLIIPKSDTVTVGKIKAAIEEAQKAFYPVAEKLYQQAAPEGDPNAAGAGFNPGAGAPNDNVVDADFEEVKD